MAGTSPAMTAGAQGRGHSTPTNSERYEIRDNLLQKIRNRTRLAL
jgi:hypothetical protein